MGNSKHKQLMEKLRSDILVGKYRTAQAFPSVRALARRYELAVATVQRALEELVREGLLTSERGRGTRVTHQGAVRKIGVMVPGVAYSEFFMPIVSEISRLAQAQGYTLIFGNITATTAAARITQAKTFARELVKENVAGVICQPLEFVADAASTNAQVMQIFDAAQVPVVLIDYDIVPPPARSKYDLVSINNYAAGAQLAKHLLALGARKIDFVMRPKCSWSVHARCDGVRNAVAAIPGASCRVLSTESDDLAALKRHLRRGRPDAFICGNDTIAAKFKQTLEAAGMQVPRDVLLAGFDDLQLASLLSPPLTTIHQPCAAMGAVAFKTLLNRIADPSRIASEIYLAAPLIVRASTLKSKE